MTTPAPTPEQFAAMGYAAQVELHASDPDTYRRLTGEPEPVEPDKVPAPTAEQFERMRYPERVAVHRDHPELYEQFAEAEANRR